jgi:hypothetical protein
VWSGRFTWSSLRVRTVLRGLVEAGARPVPVEAEELDDPRVLRGRIGDELLVADLLVAELEPRQDRLPAPVRHQTVRVHPCRRPGGASFADEASNPDEPSIAIGSGTRGSERVGLAAYPIGHGR